MRLLPRFSLRWLLILIAIIAVILYLFFVRPTVLANRFASEINQGNYSELQGSHAASFGFPVISGGKESFTATVRPRTWSDLIGCCRRIEVDRIVFRQSVYKYELHSSISNIVMDKITVSFQEAPPSNDK
jgi:hypothetical protein